jgi:hypothetical protein
VVVLHLLLRPSVVVVLLRKRRARRRAVLPDGVTAAAIMLSTIRLLLAAANVAAAAADAAAAGGKQHAAAAWSCAAAAAVRAWPRWRRAKRRRSAPAAGGTAALPHALERALDGQHLSLKALAVQAGDDLADDARVDKLAKRVALRCVRACGLVGAVVCGGLALRVGCSEGGRGSRPPSWQLAGRRTSALCKGFVMAQPQGLALNTHLALARVFVHDQVEGLERSIRRQQLLYLQKAHYKEEGPSRARTT